MKVAQFVSVLLAALAGFVWAGFQGTDEEFMERVVAGEIPPGILPPELEFDDRSLRFAREPQKVGQRCGRNTPCEDGVECMKAGPIGRYCVPNECLQSVFNSFIDRNNLHDWPQKVMDGSGYRGKMGLAVNRTTEKLGWGAAATHTASMMNDDFRQSMAQSLEANAPNMTDLLVDMVSQCPQMATQDGVTVMLGLQYELAAVATWINSFYLAVGTGRINFNVDNSTSGINFSFNVSAGVYSDICAGGGPNAGVEFGLTAGAFISGIHTDLTECSFLFDFDAGVGSSFGLSAGVTINRCVSKFLVSQGFGIGAGAGFMSCGTCLISALDFGL